MGTFALLPSTAGDYSREFDIGGRLAERYIGSSKKC
jgi:hypothetical protein